MLRALFEKTGNAVWISHLDLMRLFQRAFKRAGLTLTHTQGFNPRPSVSIALPLSVGVESCCELLDFELDGEKVSCDEIKTRLEKTLVDGIRVLDVYEDGTKIKHLSLLDCVVTMEYDAGVPAGAAQAMEVLFARDSVIVEKKGKNGVQKQDIIPMIRGIAVEESENLLLLKARICCQNPTLNPMQLASAVELYLPEYRADYVRCCRCEIFDNDEKVFR